VELFLQCPISHSADFLSTGKSIFWHFLMVCRWKKKNCPAHPVQSFVTRSGRIGAQIFFFLCPNLSNIYQNLSNSVTVNFLIGGPLAFRLFKPIVNDDYHQEHKEF